LRRTVSARCLTSKTHQSRTAAQFGRCQHRSSRLRYRAFAELASRPADCRRRTARRLRSVFLTSPLVHGSRACAGPKGAAHCGPARQTGYHRRERERIPERRNPVAGLLPSFCSSCHSRSQDYGYEGRTSPFHILDLPVSSRDSRARRREGNEFS